MLQFLCSFHFQCIFPCLRDGIIIASTLSCLVLGQVLLSHSQLLEDSQPGQLLVISGCPYREEQKKTLKEVGMLRGGLRVSGFN